MKIGIAGAGAVGCHYAAKLLAAGADVLLLARGAHLRALCDHGLLHESDGQCRRLEVAASDDVTILDGCDVILLASKMTDLEGMLAAMGAARLKPGMLATLQNGVRAPGMVAEVFPGVPVLAGTAFIGVRRVAPGHVLHTAAGGVRLAWWRQMGASAEPLLDWLERAGVPARMEPDAVTLLWRKMLWNCGFNALTAITRRYAKDMAANPETREIVEAAMREALALARHEGAGVDEDDIRKHIEVTLRMGPVKTSMWQDVEMGARTEIDELNGYVAKRAQTLGLSAPVNAMLTALVHALAS
ncbi:MAG: 2-dehydropantoate 2-reductase [Zetaproteobacteria bacterium]|nr:MAG: 2-dehydropantoate 2-reductase [Zetaproteobacteria bacterium]